MGYRIIYGEESIVEPQERKSRLRLMTAGFALALVVAVRLFWPQGTEMLRQTLLPRKDDAIHQLTEDLQAGAPIGDAVTAFCRTILEEAVAETD